MEEKRKKTFCISLAAAGCGTLVFGILWLNNLFAAWKYHKILFEGGAPVSSGFLPGLDGTAIDVSTVTTLIPFFGFLLILRGILHVRSDEEWPFFAGYDRLNIALGLLGTLWGIILIGYYPVERVTIPALMSCLHTAMFSTLAAIVWIMILKPLVITPWMKLLRTGTEEDVSLLTLTDSLLQGMASAGEEMKKAGLAASQFQGNLAGLNTDLMQNRELEATWRHQTLECLRELAAVTADFKAQQDRLSAENQQLREKNASLEKTLSETVDETARLKQQLSSIREVLR